MGAIKDLVDLVSKLSNSVNDRKLASELNSIQGTIAKLQSEHATIHETNIELREKNLELRERVQQLETENSKLRTAPIAGPTGVPQCPNCSTDVKPFFMKPVAVDFVDILNATHVCSKCGYNSQIEN